MVFSADTEMKFRSVNSEVNMKDVYTFLLSSRGAVIGETGENVVSSGS